MALNRAAPVAPGSGGGRLEVPGDVLYFPVAGGVEIRNAGGILRLRGTRLYDLLDRLVPHLDGSRTLEELCHGLREGERKSVTRVCEALLSRGMVRRVAGAATDPDPGPEEEPEPLRYIGYFVEQSSRRYRELCRAPIAVAGSGYSLLAIVHALSRFDLEAVRVVLPAASDAGRGLRYRDRIGEYLRRDWELLSAVDVAVTEASAGCDALFYATDPVDDRSQVPSLDALVNACRAEGTALIAGDFFAGWAVAGPVMEDATQSCPSCARRALAGLPGVGRARGASARSPEGAAIRATPAPALVSLLANELARQWLYLRTAAGEPIPRDAVVLFEPETLSRALFSYERSPHCPCRPPADGLPGNRGAAAPPRASDRRQG